MSNTVTRRPVAEQDDGFLFELFHAVRMPDFAQAPMAPAQLDMLMRMQYAGQKHTYGAQFPGPGHDIILVEGKPAGRIWVYRGPEAHQLVDISLMPEYRDRGIGAQLVTEAITRAAQAGVPLRCSVAVTNPGSLRFHQRLGFRIVGQDEVYYDLAVEP